MIRGVEMNRKTRAWIGITLLILVAFNYVIFAYPLVKKGLSIKHGENSILVRHVKKGEEVKYSDEDYVLEILRKEKSNINRKVRNLNYITLTCIIVVVSWTAFGLVFHKKR